MAQLRSSSPRAASRSLPPGVGHIVRIHHDPSHTWGWQARRPRQWIRVGRRDLLQYESKFYADRKWGGTTQARTLAERWLAAGVA
jgi:hypothetical protein